MTVRFRDEALQDLEEIAGYIARDNPAASFAVVARIHSVIYETLDLMPRSGHAVYGAHEFAVPHLPYVIVYKPANDDIDIIGVFVASRKQTPQTPRINASKPRNESPQMASLPRSSLGFSTPNLDGIGHVAICDIEHVRYVLPYKRTYMRFVGVNSLPDRKKSRRAMGTLPPGSGFAARPRAATPYSRRPFAFGTRVTIVLLRAVYRTRVPHRGPGESKVRSWRPRAKSIVAKGESHDTLGWRHGVGLLEKNSRPEASLFFGADIGGRVPIARRNATARQR